MSLDTQTVNVEVVKLKHVLSLKGIHTTFTSVVAQVVYYFSGWFFEGACGRRPQVYLRSARLLLVGAYSLTNGVLGRGL